MRAGDLQSLAAAGLPRHPGGALSCGPTVGPAGRSVVCPSWIQRHIEADRTAPAEGWEGEQGDFLAAQPPGLVPHGNLSPGPERRMRYGLGGITRQGRKAVREAAHLLEEQRRCLTFWTISPSDQALDHLLAIDGWSLFVRELRRVLCRRLKARGLPQHVIGVCEVSPDRSKEAGLPLAHLHLIYRSRKHSGRPWAMTPAEHDEMIRVALIATGLKNPDVRASSKCEQIRKSVARYLSKYLSKAGGKIDGLDLSSANESHAPICETPPLVCVAARSPLMWRVNVSLRAWALQYLTRLIPRQWWLQTEELHQLVQLLTLVLPRGFALWLVAEWPTLESSLGASLTYCEPGKGRAPPTWLVDWDGAAALAEALAIWEADCDDRQAIDPLIPCHGRLYAWDRAFPHQHL